MRVQINGKRWDLRFVPMKLQLGDCQDPTQKSKRIRIDSKLLGLDRLDVIIHELLHASNWEASEGQVSETATDIAKVLWRLGYRPTVET